MPAQSLLLLVAAGDEDGRRAKIVGQVDGVDQQLDADVADARVALRYVDGAGQATEHYPENPNGSPGGVTGLTNADGRVTIMMPHPERTLRGVNFSWAPAQWGDRSPWRRMFRNARRWLG